MSSLMRLQINCKAGAVGLGDLVGLRVDPGVELVPLTQCPGGGLQALGGHFDELRLRVRLQLAVWFWR